MIPAITLWEPWASLVAAGAKPYEFRSWPAPLRLWGKRIAVAAGARPVRVVELRELLAKLQGPHWRETALDPALAVPLLERALQAPKGMPCRAVVCTAVLGQPIRDAELSAALSLPHLNDSDRDEHSNWGWPLTEIRAVEPPCPAVGRQGFWEWDERLAA